MQRSLFAQLNALAEEIAQDTVKAATEKKAEPVPADPGGYAGASAHPSAHVDNKVENASTGARASEYESDVKKQQGALAVDNTPEMSQEGRQDEVQLNIGTTAKATGEDPSSEHDYKGDKDDPGTSHPAKTEDGEKYSAFTFKEARDRCSNLGNEILADLVNFGSKKLTTKAAEGLVGGQHKLDCDKDGKIEGSDLAMLRNGEKGEKAESDHDDDDAEEKDEKEAAFKAGYELASALGMDKAAAEASVREICANTLREADEMASALISYIRTKQAAEDNMDAAAEGEDHSAPADAGSGEAAPAGEAPADLEAMLGADPMAGAPAEGGVPSEDEALQELAMALEELGIPPEALLAAAGEQGGAGGMPPEGMPPEGMPPEGGPMAAPKMAAAKRASELHAIAADVINFKRGGRFQIKEARTKRSRELRDNMKNYIRELVAR
jgi:hypothetical protein